MATFGLEEPKKSTMHDISIPRELPERMTCHPANRQQTGLNVKLAVRSNTACASVAPGWVMLTTQLHLLHRLITSWCDLELPF
jgi:hypothetical protein